MQLHSPGSSRPTSGSISSREIYSRLSGPAPVLTAYGPAAGAERLDLSGKVLANHCAKAANLLGDDLLWEGDIELDLPAHWRVFTWGLGALLAGLQPVFGPADCVISADPDREADELIRTSLGALDLSWPGDLGGAVDGNAEALAQADDLIVTGALDVQLTPAAPGRYYLVDPAPADLFAASLAIVAGGASLVVVDAGHEEAARTTEGARRWDM
ncbi:MAG: hypothetical protein Q4P33_00980 [Flaviflexus sp.]|nr:hypothetical protein [Flaviflexus sp.]